MSAFIRASSPCVPVDALFDFQDFTAMSKSQTEQRAILRFLTLKALTPQQIHSELESVCHDDALALPTIDKCHARFRDRRTELSDDPRFGRPRKSDEAEVFLSMLEERAVLSCLRNWRQELGLQKFNLRSVPDILDSAQKQNRVTFSREFLEMLRREQQNNCDHVITGDESWFFLDYPNEFVWAESRDEVPVRIKQ
jgi:transposase